MIKIRKIIEFLMYIFTISSLLIPAGLVNKIVFIGIISLYGIQFIKTRKSKLPTLAPILIMLIYFYGYLKSFTSNSDSALALQFMVFAGMLLLIYPILDNNIKTDNLIKHSGLVLTFATFLLYLLLVDEISFIGSSAILKTFREYGLISMGYRGFFGEDKLFVHFGNVPFLYLPCCLYFRDYLETKDKKFLFFVALILIAMFLSTSRALVLGFILASFTMFINRKKGFSKVFRTYGIAIILLVGVIYLNLNSTVFDLSDAGNSIKIGDAKSFFENITFKNLLIGDGLASYYYAGGRGSYLSHTENTLLDSIRYFGLILSFILYCLVLMPTSKLIKFSKNKDVIYIFIIYLLMSLTNPILFNSLGGFIILWYWSRLLNFKHY